jgi:hypothetical protein
MLSSTSEKTGGFNPEITNKFFASVKQASFVWCFQFISFLLDPCLLVLCKFLFLLLLRFKVLPHRPEVALLKLFNLWRLSLTPKHTKGAYNFEFLENGKPIVEKVLLKDRILTMIRFNQRGEKASDFFRLGR